MRTKDCVTILYHTIQFYAMGKSPSLRMDAYLRSSLEDGQRLGGGGGGGAGGGGAP